MELWRKYIRQSSMFSNLARRIPRALRFYRQLRCSANLIHCGIQKAPSRKIRAGLVYKLADSQASWGCRLSAQVRMACQSRQSPLGNMPEATMARSLRVSKFFGSLLKSNLPPK